MIESCHKIECACVVNTKRNMYRTSETSSSLEWWHVYLFGWKTFHKAQLKFMRRCYPMSTCEWKSSIICEANIDNTISHLVCCSYIKHSWLSNISSSWARTFYKFSYFCYYLETLSILMNKISLLLLRCYTWFQNMNFG